MKELVVEIDEASLVILEATAAAKGLALEELTAILVCQVATNLESYRRLKEKGAAKIH